MRGSVEITFSEEAQKDLRNLGRWERPLITQVIKDQLVAPSGDVQTLDFGSTAALPQPDRSLLQPDSEWWSMPIGKYRAIVKPQRSDETGTLAGFVSRIVPEESAAALTADSSTTAVAAAAPRS